MRKLIAGPTVYICDECVEICREILSDDKVEPRRRTSAAPKENVTRYLERAVNELDAARVLRESEFARVCVEVARSSARSALQAFLVFHEELDELGSFTTLLSLALRKDSDLRRLYDLKLTALITQHEFHEEADATDARFAFETAARIVNFVQETLDAA